MTTLIKSAAENTLKIAKVKGSVVVTPSTISIEDISNEADAVRLENAFVSAGMKSLGVCNLSEIGMGEGYSLTIVI